MLEKIQEALITRTQPPTAPRTNAQDPLPSAVDGFDVGRLKATPGAIFDYLYPLIRTPQNVMDAFNVGFAGCPSINSMESQESEYSRVWRTGGKRYKQYAILRLVNADIETQPIKDRVQYTSTMHMKYTGKTQGALATLAKGISRQKRLDNDFV